MANKYNDIEVRFAEQAARLPGLPHLEYSPKEETLAKILTTVGRVGVVRPDAQLSYDELVLILLTDYVDQAVS